MRKLIIFINLILLNYSNAQWIVQYNDSTSNTILISLSVLSDSNIYIAGKKNNTGLFLKSTNGGSYWNEQIISTSDVLNGIYFNNQNTGWILGVKYIQANQYLNKIYKTTDNGLHFSSTEITIYNQANATCLFFTDINNGWIGGYKTIYRTTNSGSNWELINQSISGHVQSIYFINKNTGWIVNEYGDILKSTNGGVTFPQQINPYYGNILYSLYFVDSLNGWISGDYSRILKTTDGGNTWLSRFYNSDHSLKSIFFVNNLTGWAVGSLGYIVKTSNGGNNWTYQNSGISPYFSDIYFLNPNLGFTIGESYVIKTYNSGGVYINHNINPLPSSFSLYQNYPNPFNPTTSIKYQIKELSSPHVLGGDLVQIKVYDILGKEIETLVNEKQSPGTYEVNWDASAFPSGVYFYRLEAGDFKQTNKMILIK